VVAPTLWTACPLELRRGLPPSQLAVGHPTSADCRCRLDVTDCDLWRLPVGSIAGVSVPVLLADLSGFSHWLCSRVSPVASDVVPSRLWVTAVSTGTVTGVSMLV
jgi:hypothetical protein